MDNWRDLDPDVIAGMFDARLKSVVIRSHERMFGPDAGLWELNRGDGSNHNVSELDFSEPGIRLLLGRNGSGKSTLLKHLSDGVIQFSANLELSWIYSLPSEDLLRQWDELVSEVGESATFNDSDFDDPYMLDEIMKLPIMELLRKHQIDSHGGDISEEEGLHLLRILFEKLDDHFVGRFDPMGDGTFCGPPRSYSPRVSAWRWLLHSFRQRSSVIFSGPGEHEVIETGGEWPLFLADSNYYLMNSSLAGMLKESIREFFECIWGIEFAVFGEQPRFRFHAFLRDSEALVTLLRDREKALKAEWSLSFPLDFFIRLGPYSVASVWLDCAPDWGTRHAVKAHQMTSEELKSALRRTVVDLRGDAEEQLAEMWSRVVDAHLKVVVVRGMKDPPSDVADESSMTGSPAVGREHIIVDGYDRLNEFLSGLAEDLLELDIGVVGLRAFRADEAGWSNLPPKPGGFFGSLDFGEEMQGRQILQSPKSKFMSALVLQWQEPISGNWLGMESASQGQRDVILMLLAMAASSKDGVRATKDHLLLIDEFDQHLHPTVSSKFLEIADRRAKQSGTMAILSTHSAPVLAHPSTRQAPRIFARRTVDGAFSYSQRPPETREQLAAELGIDLLAASAYSRLFILVEGEHDEAVIQKLLATGDGGAEITGVEVVNGRGTWAYEGIWNNVLRYHSAPVLVVHDKVDRRFEKAWADLRELAGRSGEELPRWVDTDFHKMRVEIDDRAVNKKSRRGDDETDKMLAMLLGIFGGREGRPSAKDVLRLTFHGIDSPDIIRLLPIDHFLKAKTDHGSWDVAEEWWGSQRKGNPWNKEFKKSLQLTTKAVVTALENSQDGWHSELQRLYDVIRNLHLEGGPA